MKTITEQKLLDAGCCGSVKKYFSEQGKKRRNVDDLLSEAISNDDHYDAAYAISALMKPMQRVEWAILSAEEAIRIFEERRPDDDRPRKAIVAAKRYLKNPSAANAANAADATDSANAAGNAAYTAVYTAACATNAVYAAAAAAAADAATNAAYAAAFAANAAANAANAANASAYANGASAFAANTAANAVYAANGGGAAYASAAAADDADAYAARKAMFTKNLREGLTILKRAAS